MAPQVVRHLVVVHAREQDLAEGRGVGGAREAEVHGFDARPARGVDHVRHHDGVAAVDREVGGGVGADVQLPHRTLDGGGDGDLLAQGGVEGVELVAQSVTALVPEVHHVLGGHERLQQTVDRGQRHPELGADVLRRGPAGVPRDHVQEGEGLLDGGHAGVVCGHASHSGVPDCTCQQPGSLAPGPAAGQGPVTRP
ncbi:hypothetical protein GCM10009696_03870 [Kocuria himachalensis]